MKIRTGFVSNSSTTSFLIYGISLYKFKDYKTSIKQRRQLSSNNYTCIRPPYSDTTYIGKSWEFVKDDQTGLQFKQEVEQFLTEVFKDTEWQDDVKDFRTIGEAWYDG